MKVGSSKSRVADILKPVLMPTTLAEAVQAISKVAKNVALKRFPVKFSQIVKEEAMFEQRMLVPGRPVAVGELQRGPTAFSGKIETQKKTNKSI